MPESARSAFDTARGLLEGGGSSRRDNLASTSELYNLGFAKDEKLALQNFEKEIPIKKQEIEDLNKQIRGLLRQYFLHRQDLLAETIKRKQKELKEKEKLKSQKKNE